MAALVGDLDAPVVWRGDAESRESESECAEAEADDAKENWKRRRVQRNVCRKSVIKIDPGPPPLIKGEISPAALAR